MNLGARVRIVPIDDLLLQGEVPGQLADQDHASAARADTLGDPRLVRSGHARVNHDRPDDNHDRDAEGPEPVQVHEVVADDVRVTPDPAEVVHIRAHVPAHQGKIGIPNYKKAVVYHYRPGVRVYSPVLKKGSKHLIEYQITLHRPVSYVFDKSPSGKPSLSRGLLPGRSRQRH